MSNEQTRQARRHAGADDERDVGVDRELVEFDHRRHVVQFVADGDGRDLPFDELRSDRGMRPATGDDRCVDARQRCRRPFVVTCVDDDHVDARKQDGHAPFDPCADDATAHECDATGHDRSGSSRGRHPPCWGGVPPEPRTRRAAATATASATADRARRISFIVGLTRIELVTSALSGQRSNRLSYSPGKSATLSADTGLPHHAFGSSRHPAGAPRDRLSGCSRRCRRPRIRG